MFWQSPSLSLRAFAVLFCTTWKTSCFDIDVWWGVIRHLVGQPDECHTWACRYWLGHLNPSFHFMATWRSLHHGIVKAPDLRFDTRNPRVKFSSQRFNLISQEQFIRCVELSNALVPLSFELLLLWVNGGNHLLQKSNRKVVAQPVLQPVVVTTLQKLDESTYVNTFFVIKFPSSEGSYHNTCQRIHSHVLV